MKYLIVIILFASSLLYSQKSRNELLNEIKARSDIKITESTVDGENNIYRVKYPDGRIQHYKFGNTKTIQNDSIPTTVIETWNVDTMLYKDKYHFWQEVLVSTSAGYELTIGDANNNRLPEIYGRKRDYDDPPIFRPVTIFELDSTGIFDNKYVFPDSVVAVRGLYDISGNNEYKLLARSHITNYSLFYTTDSFNLLPTGIDFVFTLYPGQIDHPKFGDFDKNGITDMLFYYDNERGTHICEYNEDVNNFEIVDKILQPNGFYAGYAIGDFDLDNKTDIVYGGIDGDAFIIEAEGEHNYSLVWEKSIGGYSSYMQIATDDIDNNGKPEFWVSSITYNGTTDVTGFTCFEYTGDNEYEETYRIDFAGVFPLYAGNAFARDVNNDGTEELVFCISDYVFILQFKGSHSNPFYEIFYMTRDNLPGGFTGVTMYDLDNDGREELLIHRTISNNQGEAKECTHIFKPDFAVNSGDDKYEVVTGYILEQNYPNPFNPTTTINYSIKKDGLVTLKIYDILGKEVATLVNENKTAGNYSVNFNAVNLPSGIYFYRLTSGSFSSTKKLILLK